ncbi:MAG: CAP domain-containing protein [Rhodobacteraceae bacterium]|nr:CAP domain-containing protein [Paracoccaceae bacterium]
MKKLGHLLAAGLLFLSPMALAQDLTDHGAGARDWLNAFRDGQGRIGLVISGRLTDAAAAHAGDMARRGFFSHTGSDGSSIGDRVRAQGYGFCFVAENIAKGQGSLEQVLADWANSTGHRRNMLAPEAREFGLVRGPGNLWVMVLGRPGC